VHSGIDAEEPLADTPIDLGRFPALRRFKIDSFWGGLAQLDFLCRLFDFPSSPSGIETLEIEVWFDVDDDRRGEELFSEDEWSELDEILTSEKFISLSKIVLCLVALEVNPRDRSHVLEFAIDRNLTLPYANALFPEFRASTNTRTLEILFRVSLE